MKRERTFWNWFNIISGNKELDKSWEENQIQLRAEREWLIGDIIDFKNTNWQELLEKDFNTRYFRVVERIFHYQDDENEEDLESQNYGTFLFFLKPVEFEKELGASSSYYKKL